MSKFMKTYKLDVISIVIKSRKIYNQNNCKMSYTQNQRATGVNYQGYPVDWNGNQIMNQNYPRKGGEMKTGKHKIEIRQNMHGIKTKQTSSFYNPVTGKSQKARNVYYNEKIPMNTNISHGVLNSSNISNQAMMDNRMPYPTAPYMNPSYPTTSAMQTPMMTSAVKSRRSRSRSSSDERERMHRSNADQYYSSTSTGYNQTGYNYSNMGNSGVPIYNNAAYNPNMGMHQTSTNYIMANNSYPTSGQTASSNYNYNYADRQYVQDKGSIKTRGDTVKSKEEINYVDPYTGVEQHAKIKAKIIGGDRFTGGNKTKASYNYEGDGNQIQIEEKVRSGGVFANLKNKFQNVMHR